MPFRLLLNSRSAHTNLGVPVLGTTVRRGIFDGMHCKTIALVLVFVSHVGCAERLTSAKSAIGRVPMAFVAETNVAVEMTRMIDRMQGRGFLLEKRTPTRLVFGHNNRRARAWYEDEDEARYPVRREPIACDFRREGTGVRVVCRQLALNQAEKSTPCRLGRAHLDGRSSLDDLR